RDRHDGVVERRLDVRDTMRLDLPVLLPGALSLGTLGCFRFLLGHRSSSLALLCRGLARAHAGAAARALPGAGVGGGTLPADREPAAVTKTAVRPDVHEPLDAGRNLRAEASLDLVLLLDLRPELRRVGVGEITRPEVRVHARPRQDVLRGRPPHAEDVGEGD